MAVTLLLYIVRTDISVELLLEIGIVSQSPVMVLPPFYWRVILLSINHHNLFNCELTKYPGLNPGLCQLNHRIIYYIGL